MYVTPGTVSQTVRDVLTSNKFYHDVLQSGIAYVTALAQKIKPEIEKMVTTHVTTTPFWPQLKDFPTGWTSIQTVSLPYETFHGISRCP